MRQSEKGSALVEFALVAPLLLLLLLGILTVGQVIRAKLVIEGAAREAGRTWAIEQSNRLAQQQAASSIARGGLPSSAGGRSLFDPARDVRFDRQGEYIAVTVTYRQPVLFPLIARLLQPGSQGESALTIRGLALFRIEGTG